MGVKRLTDQHIGRAGSSPIVPAILRDRPSVLRAVDDEVGKEHIGDMAPSAAARLVIGFIIAIAARHQLANPGLDVSTITDVALSTALDYCGVVDDDVLNGGVC